MEAQHDDGKSRKNFFSPGAAEELIVTRMEKLAEHIVEAGRDARAPMDVNSQGKITQKDRRFNR